MSRNDIFIFMQDKKTRIKLPKNMGTLMKKIKFIINENSEKFKKETQSMVSPLRQTREYTSGALKYMILVLEN